MSTPSTHQLQVKGMSCQHCVKAITQAIQTQDPQAAVTVDLPQGQVSVQSALSQDAIVQAITEEGYEVQS
ncbi:MAG: heavy-metal-associated domain-containing protein [Acidobacteriota bacterium]